VVFAPIVVSPEMVTLEIRLQPLPIRTCAPTMQNGPTVTSSPITAPSSMRAVGSILLINAAFAVPDTASQEWQ